MNGAPHFQVGVAGIMPSKSILWPEIGSTFCFGIKKINWVVLFLFFFFATRKKQINVLCVCYTGVPIICHLTKSGNGSMCKPQKINEISSLQCMLINIYNGHKTRVEYKCLLLQSRAKSAAVSFSFLNI